MKYIHKLIAIIMHGFKISSFKIQEICISSKNVEVTRLWKKHDTNYI